MSFELPGEQPDGDNPWEDWEAQFQPPRPGDPMSAPDFLPSHEIPASPGRSVSATEASDSAPGKYKQIYYIGSRAVKDTPPDVSYASVKKMWQDYNSEKEEVDLTLATALTLNNQHSEVLDMARQTLASDFGDHMASARLVVLPEAAYRRIQDGPVSVGSFSVTMDRDIILAGTDEHPGVLTPAYVLRKSLMVGVLAAAKTEHIVLTRERPHALHVLGAKPTYVSHLLPLGNLTEVLPDKRNGVRMGGEFLARGYADSYALQKRNDLGYRIEIYAQDKIFGADARDGRPPVGYTDGGHNTPYLQRFTGRLMLPYSYITSAYTNPNLPEDHPGSSKMAVDFTAVGALGFNLLAGRAPGLRDAIHATITDAAAKPYMTELINSIQPGLYSELAELPDNAQGLYRGTVRILEILGLADAPVGTGLED